MAMRLIMSPLLMFRSKSLSAAMIINADIVSSDKVDRRRFFIIMMVTPHLSHFRIGVMFLKRLNAFINNGHVSRTSMTN